MDNKKPTCKPVLCKGGILNTLELNAIQQPAHNIKKYSRGTLINEHTPVWLTSSRAVGCLSFLSFLFFFSFFFFFFKIFIIFFFFFFFFCGNFFLILSGHCEVDTQIVVCFDEAYFLTRVFIVKLEVIIIDVSVYA